MSSYTDRFYEAEDFKTEAAVVKEYINAHPAPSYKDVVQAIENSDHQLAMMMWAEYGNMNHDCITAIYKHLADTKTGKDGDMWPDRSAIKEHAQRIYDRGGMQALQMNWYVLRMFVAKDVAAMYVDSHLFDGVGEWQA